MKKLLLALTLLGVGFQSCDRVGIDSGLNQVSTADGLSSSNGILVFRTQKDFDSFNAKNQKISKEYTKELEKQYSFTSISTIYSKTTDFSGISLIFAGPMGAALNQDLMVVIESVLYQFSATAIKQIQLTEGVDIKAAASALLDGGNRLASKVVKSDITYKTVQLGATNPRARGEFGNNTVVANQMCADDFASPSPCIWAEATVRLGKVRTFFPARDVVLVNIKISRNGNFRYEQQATPYTATVGAYGNFTVHAESFNGSSVPYITAYDFPFSYNFDGQPSETEINVFTSPATTGNVSGDSNNYFTGDINYHALYNQPIDKVPAGQGPTNITGYYLFQP